MKHGELTIAILPLQKNAPIYLPDSAKPDFGLPSEALAKEGAADSVVALTRAELVPNSLVEAARP